MERESLTALNISTFFRAGIWLKKQWRNLNDKSKENKNRPAFINLYLRIAASLSG